MKDQITTLMEALRLVGREVEHFKGREATLDAILDDPQMVRAIENIQPFVDAPGLVPDQSDAPALV